MNKILAFLVISIFLKDAVSQRLRNLLTVLLLIFDYFFKRHFHISEKYNVDPYSITVGGFSSGAIMANQFHIAHSSKLAGAGILSGGFFFHYKQLSESSNKILNVQCPTYALDMAAKKL